MYKNITLNYEPFYVGMGKGKRCYMHLREAFNWKKIHSKNYLKINKIRKIFEETNNKPKIFKIKNLTKEEACNLEIELIKYFGRIDNKTGILTNMTNGGENGSPMLNKHHSEETKKKMSEAKIGKQFSDEHKNNLKKASLKESRNNKLREHYKNITKKEHENRSNARFKSLEKIKSDEEKYKTWKQNISKSHKGQKAYNKIYNSKEEKLKAFYERRKYRYKNDPEYRKNKLERSKRRRKNGK